MLTHHSTSIVNWKILFLVRFPKWNRYFLHQTKAIIPLFKFKVAIIPSFLIIPRQCTTVIQQLNFDPVWLIPDKWLKFDRQLTYMYETPTSDRHTHDTLTTLDRDASTTYRPTLSRQYVTISSGYRLTIDRVSANSRPTIDRIPTNYRPMCRSIIDRLSIIGSTERLPNINMDSAANAE